MNPCIIARSIIGYLKQDDGPGGIFEGGAWQFITGGMHFVSASPAGVEPLPYGVLSVEMRQAIGFRDDRQEVTLTIDLYAQASRGFDTLESATARIYGDGILQPNKVPTYGLHRLQSVPVVGNNPYSATINGLVCQSQTCGQVDETVVTAQIVFTCSLQINGS
jgi:hypothetical protein